jgi:hypothetical protein
VRYVRVFARFWWEFVAGDDWRVAAGLALAFGLSALLVHESIDAWWLLPLAVLALLTESLRRAIRSPADAAAGARSTLPASAEHPSPGEDC